MRLAVSLTFAAVFCASAAFGVSTPIEIERDVVYAERDGKRLRADIYRPAGNGTHPAVLVVHGGSWHHGSKWHMRRVGKQLAESGFVAVAINYRLAPWHRFPAQIHDCKEAVRWMRRNAATLRVDPERIGGFGYSAGGHLVALLATTDADDGLEGAVDPLPTRIAAAVAGAAPTDLRRFIYNPAFYFFLGGSQTALPATYAAASPITFVTADDPPMFLYHGRRDLMVSSSQSKAMVSSLRLAGVPAEYYEAGGGHIYTFLFGREPERAAIAFLARWLRSPVDVAAIERKTSAIGHGH